MNEKNISKSWLMQIHNVRFDRLYGNILVLKQGKQCKLSH